MIRLHLWEIESRFAPGLSPGWSGAHHASVFELLHGLPLLERIVRLRDIRAEHLRFRGFIYPPWSRVEGLSQVNLPQMLPLRGSICMVVD